MYRHAHIFTLASNRTEQWRGGRLMRITETTGQECECGKRKLRTRHKNLVWDRKDHNYA